MNDVRNDLERARTSAPPIHIELNDVYRRQDQNEGRRRIGALVVALGICAALLVGLLTVSSAQPGQNSAPMFGSPTGPSLALADGEYAYAKTDCTIMSQPASQHVVCPDSATWWATDGSGRRIVGSEDRTFGPGGFPADTGDLSTLSLDEATLEQQLRDRTAPGGASPEPYSDFTPGPSQEGHVTAGLVRAIGELLEDPNATPELKASLFRVLAGLQGMDVVESSTDPVGRPAIELAITTEEQKHHLWFDPRTQQLLARGDVFGDGTYWLSVVARSGVAASTTSTDLIRSFVPKPEHDPTLPIS
jgi:hypothetical protein